jgi:dienelactone hydrolase
MKHITKLMFAVPLALASVMALAQTPAQAPAGAAGAGAPRAPRAEWPEGYIEPGIPQPKYMPANTPLGSGPYKAIMATEPGAEDFVAYYPANLAALGAKKLPVVVWGNGSCTYRGNKFRHFLTDIASYGYFALGGGPMGPADDGRSETITIGSNNPLRNPLAPPTPPATPATPPDPNAKSVTVAQLSKGIDWAIAENKRQGSKFFGKLDTANIAVMGQSCGAGLASNFGNDPRVKTVGLWSGGAGNLPVAEIRAKLVKPVLIISGDARYDVAYYGSLNMIEALKGTRTPAFYAFRVNMTHLGTYRQTDGGELSPIARGWLDWQLKGDQNAAKMFKGVDCTVCKQLGWHAQTNNLN